MNKVYPLTTDKSWKSALLDTHRLLLLSSSQKDADKFMAAYGASGVKSWLNTKKEIGIAGITSLRHKELKPADLTVQHGKKAEKLTFETTEDLEEFTAILAKTNKLKPEVRSMSKLKASGGWLIGLGLTALFGWIMHGFSVQTEPYHSNSGRHRWAGKLMYELAQKMGPELVLTVSGAIAAFIVYKIYSNVKNPPNEVVYE
jgi:hypothetical protein